jgi:hypothetical protein
VRHELVDVARHDRWADRDARHAVAVDHCPAQQGDKPRLADAVRPQHDDAILLEDGELAGAEQGAAIRRVHGNIIEPDQHARVRATVGQPDITRFLDRCCPQRLFEVVGAPGHLLGLFLRGIAAAVDADVAQRMGALAQAVRLAAVLGELRLLCRVLVGQQAASARVGMGVEP